jgi:hypothetical protein
VSAPAPHRTPDGCGCCEGVSPLTPASIANAPGLAALVYRVGTHGRFATTMRARLSREPALDGLTTRDADDPAIALLDAGAAMLDVLTFYQERIANEAYLRTATERRSLLELARAIGYELAPGSAAETWIAFTVDDSPGAPALVPVDAGTKVQSVPGPDETPQTFETAEPIEARPEWNALRPAHPPLVGAGDTTLRLAGIATGVTPGDLLLILELPERTSYRVRRVAAVDVDTVAGRTDVTLEDPVGLSDPALVEVHALRETAGIFGNNAPYYHSLQAPYDSAFRFPWDDEQGAPTFRVWDDSLRGGDSPVLYNYADIFLDRPVRGLKEDDYVVLRDVDHTTCLRIRLVHRMSVTGFTLSSTVTGMFLRRLDGEELNNTHKDTAPLSNYLVRTTSVHTKNEKLDLVETPETATIPAGQTFLYVKGLVDPTLEGRPVALAAGEGADAVREVRTVVAVSPGEGSTRLDFDAGLEHDYPRRSLVLNANVARATHGEGRVEVLGSGDASRAFQRFTLKQTPLTWVQASTTSGRRSTLEVRVNDLLWHEVPSLYGRGPKERVFVTRADDEGKVTVRFGDGKTGARLPTGTENVVARYRVGVGTAANVGSDRLTTLLSRPLGLREATNPTPAEGGSDPETRDRARRNAPLTVRTLERAVSLLDYEDFARTFSGVGKARAAWVWDGAARVVNLTVAGDAGEVLDATSTVMGNLAESLDTYRDPLVQLRIAGHDPVSFSIDADVAVLDDWERDTVMAGVRAAVREAFSFEARQFGQPVTRAEVLAVIQGVEGVRAVDLNALHAPGSADPNPAVLPAATAHWDDGAGNVARAELLTLGAEETDLQLGEMIG